jgi:3-hydroxybutyryl-CoA dehydrogenase
VPAAVVREGKIPAAWFLEQVGAKGMQLGCGYPMGPLTLLDFVGLDTTYYIANIMFEEFREKRFAPPPLLKRMVQAGMNGKKAGKGFYDYAQDPPRPCTGLV